MTKVFRVKGIRLFTRPLLAVLGLLLFAHGVMAQSLAVSGISREAKIFSLSALEALGLTEATEGRDVTHNGQTQRLEIRYSGVLLTTLLVEAGIENLERYKLRAASIVITASDGYKANFSWGELFNSRAGANVLIITRENGERLSPREGTFSLRSLSDLRPGPRHVRLVMNVHVVVD